MQRYSTYILYLLITVLVVVVFINDTSMLTGIQTSLNDTFCKFSAPESSSKSVAVVSIDEKAIAEYGAWPWNRDLVADLVAAIAQAKPKTVVLDLDLTENPGQDSAGYTSVLAGQMSWVDGIVLPFEIAPAQFRSTKSSNPRYLFEHSVAVDNPLGAMDEMSSIHARKVFLPAEKLLETKPYLGFDYIIPDEDRMVRRQQAVVGYDGYYYPSLPVAAAAAYFGVKAEGIRVEEGTAVHLGGTASIPIDNTGNIYIQYSSGGGVLQISAADILSEKTNLTQLANRLIIVAVDDRNEIDSYNTAIKGMTTETAIKATIIGNILDKNFITVDEGRRTIHLLVMFALGGLCAFLFPSMFGGTRMTVLAGILVALVGVNYYFVAFSHLLVETVQYAILITLFAIASPFVPVKESAAQAAKQLAKKKAKADKTADSATGKSAHLVTREIMASPTDNENLSTSYIDRASHAGGDYPSDHQAVNLGDTGEVESPSATSDSPDSSKLADGNGTPSVESKSGAGAPEPIAPVSRVTQETPNISNLGRYQVTGVLGKGAMGTVYKGIDPAINRPLALKTIRLDFVTDPEEMEELKERLFREAQAAGKLSHPNIVTIYDVGSEGHLQYIAMEYLEGQTLEELIKKKVKFNYKIIAQIIVQICSALEYAHSQGIVHRDIKPANIMILSDYRVKVMDYGIARIDSNSMTKTGIAMGTPNYISPEQLKGKSSDQRADIFSLGVVMYEILLGRRPFRGENITSLIYNILNHEPEKPSSVNPQIPLIFDHVIMRALRKNPVERYGKASELRADLADFVESFASR
jgi:eukaryotic-like serine/threonine-protein kinase